MQSKIPLIAAVVGALLVGGATTGTTRASWTSQASLRSSSVGSGQMGYTATTPAGVTVNKVAGSTADTTFVLDDTSLGKNLAQSITASVGTTPTGVSATVGTSCPGGPSVSVDTTPTSPDQTLCVRVTSSSTAVSGNVTINLNSAQRPTAGWTTPAITRTVAVTVNQPATLPAPTGLACTGGSGTSVLTWNAVSGATGYQVFRADNNALIRSVSGTSSGNLVESDMGSPVTSSQKYSLHVKATNSTSTSGASGSFIIQFKPNGGCAG